MPDGFVLYPEIEEGAFMGRDSRFSAHVRLASGPEKCHVKSTARLGELLMPGAKAIVAKAGGISRATAYDLVAVYKGGALFNIDSQAPNKVFGRFAKEGGFSPAVTLLKAERSVGDSRFDFYLESPSFKGYVEVKGVTLEREGVGYFPDAPTERGVKHLAGLMKLRAEGMDACACFILQFEGARGFAPNEKTHPEFAQALREAKAAGVELRAYGCRVDKKGFEITEPVPILL
ncbi:MAG: DNA/RNA nuclease SfsA [Christensenellaceae bacterium]|jgi:sugar fermentation stimulation protein A|nr:DNA/RNA nuclease SfsA [Christensenellaceae bacterium]